MNGLVVSQRRRDGLVLGAHPCGRPGQLWGACLYAPVNGQPASVAEEARECTLQAHCQLAQRAPALPLRLRVPALSARPVTARMALLLSAATLVPSLGLGQEVTGPLVNALLILSVGLVGVSNAIVVGFAPSFMAWGRGLLPAPLLVMIPYIIIGNALLVVTYGALRRYHYWIGVLAGAGLKCAFLWGAVTLVGQAPRSIELGREVTPVAIPATFALMFQYPQFVTAVAGGAIAWAILKGYQVWREHSH